MKIQLKTMAATAALIAGIISVQAVYAEGTGKSLGSMMGQGGMMSQSGQMQGGQGGHMGQGGMMGMMNMMEHMHQMMRTMMRHQKGELPKPSQTQNNKK